MHSILGHDEHDLYAGKKEFNFSTMAEFVAWKNEEENSTRTSYVKTQQTYHPVSEGIM